ncbi:MAG: basic amino acid/polyamine antiporter, family, partial [Pseudonocardiales bacterium]|nr:basic amino acid/polyamine antiporter, family [Pseudonocardiales bacterium]
MAGDRRSRVKSIEQSIADTDEPDSKLRKELGALDLVVFGVAVAVGAGIFTLTARARYGRRLGRTLPFALTSRG